MTHGTVIRVIGSEPEFESDGGTVSHQVSLDSHAHLPLSVVAMQMVKKPSGPASKDAPAREQRIQHLSADERVINAADSHVGSTKSLKINQALRQLVLLAQR